MISIVAAALVGQAYTHEPFSSYQHLEIASFKVHVSAIAQKHPETTKPALDLLKSELEEVNATVPKEALKTLHQIPIFMEHDNPAFPCACYHGSPDWLKGNGYIKEKENAVEVANTKNFVAWINLNQPLMVLHELAHAYHDVKFGFDEPYIRAAYSRALKSGTYESVAHNRGTPRRAYALNNQMEYFAELTEAYFNGNDFYPFLRSELAAFDPKGLQMIRWAWGIEGATGTFTRTGN